MTRDRAVPPTVTGMQVITADLVLAGPDLAPVERGAVLVDGDRIAWVGRAADLAPDRYRADTPVLALGPGRSGTR